MKEGDWELRDGKFFRRDIVSISQPQTEVHTVKVKCPNCPIHLAKIEQLTAERDRLQKMLKERDALIAQLKARLEKLEMESRQWLQEKARLENIIREREKTIRELRALLDQRKDWVPPHVLREKEVIIQRLRDRIRELEAQLANAGGLLKEKEALVLRVKELEGQLADRDATIARLQDTINDLRARIRELEDLLIKARSVVQEVREVVVPPKPEPLFCYSYVPQCQVVQQPTYTVQQVCQPVTVQQPIPVHTCSFCHQVLPAQHSTVASLPPQQSLMTAAPMQQSVSFLC
eukprot:GGOE01003425.1.p1 GENE.GGOE01003425.1~~GGOE01003425.1.p1  ORF type:complete len:308 (-),score=115.10 GGOE01003425.1:536-1405(-)